MYTPEAKRRRVENASKALSKPFKSPFRTPTTPNPNASDASPHSQTPLTAAPSLSSHKHTSNASSNLATAPPNPSLPAPAKTSHLPKTHLTPRAPCAPAPQTTHHRQLERRAIQTRQDLDTLRQALEIARSGCDDELERLVGKWRAASRAAAEEVFAGVRDRVMRMGGVGAWRERERKRGEWGRWDDEGGADGRGFNGGDGGEEENGEEMDEEEAGRMRRRLREEAEAQYGEGDAERREEVKVVDEGRDDDVGCPSRV